MENSNLNDRNNKEIINSQPTETDAGNDGSGNVTNSDGFVQISNSPTQETKKLTQFERDDKGGNLSDFVATYSEDESINSYSSLESNLPTNKGSKINGRIILYSDKYYTIKLPIVSLNAAKAGDFHESGDQGVNIDSMSKDDIEQIITTGNIQNYDVYSHNHEILDMLSNPSVKEMVQILNPNEASLILESKRSSTEPDEEEDSEIRENLLMKNGGL